MTLQATPAASSRITKTRRPSAAAAFGLKRSTSSLSKASPRKKSLPQGNSRNYHDDEKLDDTGVMASLAHDLNFRDVPQYMEYIRHRMFSHMPEKPGMNSTRIAEVLNFRAKMPPFVTIAHIDALTTSSTRIEREIAELAQAGIVRRVTIPHRGLGAAAVGDGIASVNEWQALIQRHQGLPDDLKEKYISIMRANPTSASIPGTTFTPSEITSLTTTGFLTSSTTPSHSSYFASPGAASLTSISSSGSRHAAGSLDAVGGSSATQHIHGGTSINSSRPSLSSYNFSLPNTGTLIKLLVDARNHLLAILKRTKYNEMPLLVLRERWDGGLGVREDREPGRSVRGGEIGVLPGRTKKWKVFYGLRFEWVLEGCVGAGLVEVFETGSVGRGVRVTN
ncbi:serine-threonine protein kinase 19 [Phaeosphaeriaceae sp. PMI808]|nr:serine-threonine protein kinase 19 [Phaeosphaeriaceae sp. PMI808]